MTVDIVFEMLKRKYLARLRRRYLKKKIENEHRSKFDERRVYNRKLKELKEKLKNENINDNEIIKIIKEIKNVEKKLKEIENKIKEECKFEYDLIDSLKNIERECDKHISKYMEGLISKEEIEIPVNKALEKKKKEIALIGLRNEDLIEKIIKEVEKADEGKKPEAIFNKPSPSEGEVVVSSPSAGGKGVGGIYNF